MHLEKEVEMDKVLNKNLRLLEKYQPKAYKKVNDYFNGRYNPEYNLVERMLIVRNEDIIINMVAVCSGVQYLLFDHEDPIGQAYKWIEKYIDPANKVEIVFGCGFGFHLEALLTSFKNKTVIVVEPDISLFCEILKVRNLEPVIMKGRIYVDENINTVINEINPLFWDKREGGIQCEPFEVYATMFDRPWDELREKFIKHVENFIVDISTRKYFGELWIKNNIQNAEKISETSNAFGLLGKFSGIPGILVSAGPSLDKNIHLLKGLKDKCIIMAAGTAARILDNYGMEPHFMVAVDAGEDEADIHRAVKSRDIYFIYSNQVAPKSVEVYPGPKFLINYPVDLYTAYFLEFAGIKSDFILTGPSVSNTSFDLLCRMGCNPVIMVGQDMAYTGGILYAGKDKGFNMESVKDPQQSGYILTEDIYGNEVYTTMAFNAIKYWFEGYIETLGGNVDFINATEGGQNIKGARNAKLTDVIKEFDFKSGNFNGCIKEIYDKSRFPGNITEKLSEYKILVKNEILKIEKFSVRQMMLVELLKKDIYHPAKGKKAFERVVNEISTLSDNVIKSPVYFSLLRNLVEIDFYLLKMELERAVSDLSCYQQVKDHYINAIKEQNQILEQSLKKVKLIID